MSLITDLLHGKIDPPTFVAQAAADIKKDLGWLQAFPGGTLLESWLLSSLEKALLGKLSPTVVAVIDADIRSLLGLTPPTPSA